MDREWKLFGGKALIRNVICLNLLILLIVALAGVGYVKLERSDSTSESEGTTVGIMGAEPPPMPESPTRLGKQQIVLLGVLFFGLGMIVATLSALYFMRSTNKTAADLAKDLARLKTDPNHELDSYPGLLGELAALFKDVSRLQHEAHQLLSLVLNNLDCAVMLIDRNQSIRFANRAAYQWFNLAEEDNTISIPDEAREVFNMAISSLRNGVKLRNEICRLQVDEQLRILELNTTYLNLYGHYRDSVMLIARDVTQYKVLEEQMVQSDQLAAAGQLAAEAVHEIRNPLTAIRGFSQLIASMTSNDPVVPKYANYMIEEVDRLDGIIRELLELARPAEGNWSECDVREIVEEAITIIRPKAVYYGIEIINEISESLLINCQRNKIKQVFTNLMLNAVQAMPEGGTLTVTGSLCEGIDYISVEISDTGCGIPKHMRDSIFQPFVTTKPKGTGLGLVVVSKIISEHGGLVEVESQEGQGTTFNVKLPINPPNVQPIEQEFLYF